MIEALTGQGIDVRHVCRTLSVSESGFYAWKTRPASPRPLRRIWLASEIVDVHKASGGTYGANRVRAELWHGREIRVGHGRGPVDHARTGDHGPSGPTPAQRHQSGEGHLAGSRPSRLPSRRARPAVDDRHHRASHPRGQGRLRRRPGCLLAVHGRLVDRQHPDDHARSQRARDGRSAGGTAETAS